MSFVRVYGRKSRLAGDPDDLDVFAHQIRPLLRIAEKRGIAVAEAEVVVEVGSGETIAARPRFAAIIEELERLPADSGGYLIVAHPDRLSRSALTDCARIEAALQRANVKLLAANRLLDLRDADDAQYYESAAVNSRHELQRHKQRVAEKRHEMCLAGLIVTGRVPRGYRWDKNGTGVPELGKLRGRVLLVEGEAAIVRRLFLDAPHKSLERLAADTGVPMDSIAKILHNPVYTGRPARHLKTVLSRNGKPYARRLSRQERVWPEQAGSYPAIISIAEFEAAEAALAARWKRREKTTTTDGWCRDVVTLEGEPARVTLASQPIQGRNVPVYRFRREDDSLTFVPRATVNAAAERAIQALLRQPALLLEAIEHYEARATAETAGGPPDRLRTELARLRRELANHLRAEAADAEEAMAREQAKQTCKAEIAAVQRLLQEEESRPAPAQHRLRAFMPAASQAEGTEFADLAAHEQRLLAAQCLARIVVRITAMPGREPWRREVARVEYADWLTPFVASGEGMRG